MQFVAEEIVNEEMQANPKTVFCFFHAFLVEHACAKHCIQDKAGARRCQQIIAKCSKANTFIELSDIGKEQNMLFAILWSVV